MAVTDGWHSAAVGRLSQFDRARLARLLVRQRDVVTRAQAEACALTEAAIRHRIRANGPWQTLLPGVYLASSGAASARQRVTAAYLYAGNAIAITGPAALVWYSLPSVHTDDVDVLVPLACYRKDERFARLHRTSRVPVCAQEGVVRYASPPRAVADTVRRLTNFADIRAVVAGGVQRRKMTVADLAAELQAGPMRGSAQLRAALAEVADGVRSAAEGDLHALVKRERLPEPMYNARLFVDNQLLAVPDAWWPQAGLAVEVDSREWHLSPADWERTLARGARMTEHGILVMRFTPRQIRTTGPEVASKIRAVLGSTEARPLPGILATPA